MTKTFEDFQASVRILRKNIQDYHSGFHDSYRVVAGELRKLLCDGKGTLLPRIYTEVKLHPLAQNVFFTNPSIPKPTFSLPLCVRLVPVTQYWLNVVGSQAMMPLDQWVSQPLLSTSVTIWEFIKSVADKEDAHSDPFFNDTLNLAASINLGANDFRAVLTIALGEYILQFIEMAPHTLMPGIKD